MPHFQYSFAGSSSRRSGYIEISGESTPIMNQIGNNELNENLIEEAENDDSGCCCCFTNVFKYLKRKLFERDGESQPKIARRDDESEPNTISVQPSWQNTNNYSINAKYPFQYRHPDFTQHILNARIASEIARRDNNGPQQNVISVPSSVLPNVNNFLHVNVNPAKRKKKNKNEVNKKNKNDVKFSNKNNIPPFEIMANRDLVKYWKRRYSLFSKYDQGIRLDAESWYSVTPEKIGKHLAKRCRCDVIVDGFCGAGGNSIQFAFTCERVIAIDIDSEKIKLAKHNAAIYGVDDRIEFICGDFFDIAPRLIADVIFLSPPWGGPQYTKYKTYGLDKVLEPHGGKKLFDVAKTITEHIAYYLPKNIDKEEVKTLTGGRGIVEIETNSLQNRPIAITAYYGELAYEENYEEYIESDE